MDTRVTRQRKYQRIHNIRLIDYHFAHVLRQSEERRECLKKLTDIPEEFLSECSNKQKAVTELEDMKSNIDQHYISKKILPI